METLPPTIYVAIGTLLAAFVAGAISLVNLVISKEQKISELRQVWINDLRNEVSDFISQANSLYISWNTLQRDGKGDPEIRFLNENRSTIAKFDSLSHRIKLRLNPKEHQVIIELIDSIEDHCSNPQSLAKFGEAHLKFKQLNNETQKVLKTEWERVKKGEGGFVFLKRFAIFIALVPLVLGIWYYFDKIA